MIATSKSTGLDTPKIVIADDHEIYRRGLKLFLEHAGMRVIASAATGSQAVDATIKHRPDVLILDIAMPDLDGLAALSIVKFFVPETRIIILTALTDLSYLTRAIELGADGFFSKGVENHQLVNSIRGIAPSSGSSISTKTIPTPTTPKAFNLLFSRNDQSSSKGQDLTEKETLILTLISMGFANQEIADHVTISTNTLKTHMRKIYSKLSVSDRSQAAIWALRNGF